jgi:hypothetical protein
VAYIADLAPYDYYRGAPDGLAVGWLDEAERFASGDCPRDVRDRLAAFAEDPVRLMRGRHVCQFCWEATGPPTFSDRLPNLIISHEDLPRGNGEIWITAPDGTNFAAPTLIVHYIDEHHYLPPKAFIVAVRDGAKTDGLDR